MGEIIGEIMALAISSRTENTFVLIMNGRTPDFIAILKYNTSEEGGRVSPTRSGYRPQVKFAFEEMQTSGKQVFIDKALVYPGDSVEAEITMGSPLIFKGRLSAGMQFQFRKGDEIIGTGQVIKILNHELIILPRNLQWQTI